MAENTFFDKLEKIFRKGILLKGQEYAKIRNFDIEKIQSKFNLDTNITNTSTSAGFLKSSYYADNILMNGIPVTRKNLYMDYEAMDTDPRLSSALDIYSDECLGPDTIIPLLNGEKLTIEELYKKSYTNFWVYSLNSTLSSFQPNLCERVAYNGKKKMFLITLEDETIIEATENHIWVSNNNTLISTSQLKIGDSIKAFQTENYDYNQEHQYEALSELIDYDNHKIINIEYKNEKDAYDLVNVNNSHIYAIETKNGSKLFCHNCTTRNEFGDIITIDTEDENVKNSLENLFYDILNIEFNLWPWTRILVKYGDLFLKLDIIEKIGVTNGYPLSCYAVQRIDEENGNTEFKYDPSLNLQAVSSYKVKNYKDYEVIHFRLLSDFNLIPYGKSILENGRRTWKRITLLEDAMLLQRIMRAPERRVIKVDVGNIPPNEVATHMNLVMNNMKKVPYMDPETGDYNLRFNILNSLEDWYLPVRGDKSGTSFDTLPGMEFTGLEDIQYEMNNLLSSLKIPKSFLTFEENVNAKSNLASEDVRFSRSIERVQRVLETELTKIALIHLYSQGFSDEQLTQFEIKLTTSSKLADQERIELWKSKLELANDFISSKLVPRSWIYSEIFNFTTQDIDIWTKTDIPEDLKMLFRYSQIEEQGNDPLITKETSETEIDEKTWKESKTKKINNLEDLKTKKQRLIKATFEQLDKTAAKTNERQIERKKQYRKEMIRKMKNHSNLLNEKNILTEEEIQKKISN